jgi:hypothetical protein
MVKDGTAGSKEKGRVHHAHLTQNVPNNGVESKKKRTPILLAPGFRIWKACLLAGYVVFFGVINWGYREHL